MNFVFSSIFIFLVAILTLTASVPIRVSIKNYIFDKKAHEDEVSPHLEVNQDGNLRDKEEEV